MKDGKEESSETPYTAVVEKSRSAATAPAALSAHHSQQSSKLTVPKAYRHIPETHGLNWSDNFFDNNNDDNTIIAVFDFDYAEMLDFQAKVTSVGHVACLAGTTAYCGLMFGAPGMLYGVVGHAVGMATTLTPCCMHNQIVWDVQARHVALTRDGVRFVHDERPSCWGASMCNRGKLTKVIPYDQITDCALLEPAGNECLVVPRILTRVTIDTNANPNNTRRRGGRRHELSITGLRDAEKFRNLVLAMKRETVATAYEAPPPMQITDRGMASPSSSKRDDASTITGTASPSNHTNVTTLLRGLQNRIEESNKLLRNLDTQASSNTNNNISAIEKARKQGTKSLRVIEDYITQVRKDYSISEDDMRKTPEAEAVIATAPSAVPSDEDGETDTNTQKSATTPPITNQTSSDAPASLVAAVESFDHAAAITKPVVSTYSESVAESAVKK